MKDTPMLKVENASYAYVKGKNIFSDINFSLDKGDIFTILGPNGVGKSTFLNCLGNLMNLNSGKIFIDGKEMSKIPLNELAKEMGYIPQIHTSSFDYSVSDYIVMGRAPYMSMLKTPGKEEYDKVYEVMDNLKISHMANKAYSQLSGGEKQQVQIAKVLVQKSKIILLDEPTNHLDYGNQIKILKILADLSSRGITILMTTHMPDHAILLGGKVGMLKRGGNMSIGTSEDIITEDSLNKIYNTDLHLIYVDKLKRNACIAGNIR